MIAMGFSGACSGAPTGVPASDSEGLVFIRIVDGTPDVLRARISDGAVRAVTATPDRSERWPYWSNGAQRLLYQVAGSGESGDSDLILWDPETASETRLAETPHRSERWASWSPDGRWIAHAFLGGRPLGGIAAIDWRTRKVTVIARSGRWDFFLRPNFSPDGNFLVAQRRNPGRESSNLWILSSIAAPRRLTTDLDWNDTKAWFTRNGSRIVYTRRPEVGGHFDVTSISLAGDGRHTIAGSNANEHSARPSPTRDEVAFVSDRDGSSDIFLANLDDGSLRNLLRTPDRNELAPRWSPDGERLVVTTVPRDVADFGSMNATALQQARLVVLDREGNKLLDTPGASRSPRRSTCRCGRTSG